MGKNGSGADIDESDTDRVEFPDQRMLTDASKSRPVGGGMLMFPTLPIKCSHTGW